MRSISTQLLRAILSALLLAWPAWSQPGSTSQMTIPAIPASVDDFVSWRDSVATTPEGGAAVFVMALLKYSEDQKLGQHFLTVAIDAQWLTNKADGYKGKAPLPRYLQALKERIAGRPYVARSYLQGTSPENNYSAQFPATLKILEQSRDQASNARNRNGSGSVKLFVYSSGADSPRPIELRRNDKGLWKAYNWSSLESGVRPPKTTTSDDI